MKSHQLKIDEIVPGWVDVNQLGSSFSTQIMVSAAGFRALCTCGFIGEPRQSSLEAQNDFDIHELLATKSLSYRVAQSIEPRPTIWREESLAWFVTCGEHEFTDMNDWQPKDYANDPSQWGPLLEVLLRDADITLARRPYFSSIDDDEIETHVINGSHIGIGRRLGVAVCEVWLKRKQ